MMKKVLIIAQNFPPLGGAGVQRTLKFVKYLPLFGWYPVVVTGSGTSQSNWTPEDKSMLNEIPSNLPIYRSNDEADIETVAIQAFLEHKPELVLVSMSPFSHAEVAENISKRFKVPWVADLRDPWALDEFQVWRTAWHKRKVFRDMLNAIQSAALVIMNTPQAELNLRNAFPQIAQSKISNITNGYDAEDFLITKRRICSDFKSEKKQKFTIVHSGFLHSKAGIRQQKRKLWNNLFGGSTFKVRLLSRSHYYLVQALEKWQQQEPEISNFVKIILAGNLTDIDKGIVDDSSVSPMFEFKGYLSHKMSVELVCSADLLFLPMHTLSKGLKSSIVPGKTYEYLASKNPILAAVPEGDAYDFLKESGTAKICAPENVDGMLNILKTIYSNWSTGSENAIANANFIEQFERRRLTQKLAELLNQTINKIM